jgi:hypothetical protein
MIEEEPSELAERHLLQWIELNSHVFGNSPESAAIPLS